MLSDPRLQALLELFDTILLVVERPVVQRQLAAFAAVFFLAWLLPFLFNRAVSKVSAVRTAGQRHAPLHRSRRWQRRLIRWARGVEYTFFPILGLIFSELLVGFFESQGWRAGLIKQLRPIFWLLLVYRVLAGLLLSLLAEEQAGQYIRRFLAPLFIILVIVSLYTGLAGTFPLGQIELVSLLDTPVTLQSLFGSVVILYFFLAFAWIARDLLNRLVVSRANTDTGMASAVAITSYYTILGIGILTAVGTLGFNLSALAIIGGGLSVGVGFGLQELIANFVSGILLLFEQSLRPGDVIEVGGTRGTVDKLRMRSTVLRTLDNVEIFVPNKTLLTSNVATYTHSDRVVRRLLPVGVSYSSNPEQVRDILLAVASKHGLVLTNPAPTVLFSAFGESSLDFQLAVWLNDPLRANQILSDLHFMIWRELEKAHIEIPFPQRDLHVRSTVPWPSETRSQSIGVDHELAEPHHHPLAKSRLP